MYRLTLLGGVSLSGPQGPLTGRATQQRRLALLALLGSAGDTGRTRDQLIALLWPDTSALEARQHLSHSLYVLRKALGEDSIHTASEYVRIETSRIAVDVLAFEDALRRGDYEAAIAAYAGPFLDGFHIADAPEYSDWVESERRDLASRYGQSLERLARAAGAAGEPAAASRWWERLVAHDPFNSAAVVQQMAALAAAGDRANAIQCAESHVRRLAEQLGLGPPAEVVAKIEELRATSGRNLPRPPAGRAQWGAEVGSGIEGGVHVRASPPTAAAPLSRFVTVLALGLAVAVGLSILRSTVGSGSRPALLPNAVMVRQIENLTGDPALDQVGRYATSLLEGGLAALDPVRVVSADEAEVARDAVEREQRLAGAELLRQMARQTRAGLAIEGSFMASGDSLLLEARLIDVSAAEVVDAVRTIGPMRDYVPAIQSLRDRLLVAVSSRLKLGEPYAESYGRAQSFDAWQEVDAARELYLEGGREREALGLLYRAMAIDSTFDAAVGLAMIWHMNFGEYAESDSLARVLDSRIALIPARQRWQLAVNKAVLRRDRAAMLKAFRDWKDRLPNASRWLHLAMAASLAQRPRECLSALDHVDLRGSRYARSGWYWELAAECQRSLGDHRRSLASARKGRERFPESAALVLAEVRALGALGRFDEAMRLVDTHLAEPADGETYQHEWMFSLLVDPGLELRAHGYPSEAAGALERAVVWYRERADRRDDAADRWRLARALYAAERWEEAREALAALSPDDLAADPGLMRHNIDVCLLGYRATLAARLGDEESARRLDEELSSIERPYVWGHATYWRAALASVQGQKERAVELLARAMSEGLFAQPWGGEYPKWDYAIDPDFESLRHEPAFRELVAPRG